MVGVYAAVNIASLIIQKGNIGAQVPVWFNILGYMPQAINKGIKSFKEDHPYALDATFMNKIVGSVVVGAAQIVAEKYGAEFLSEKGAAGLAAIMGYVGLAASITDISGRFLQRLAKNERYQPHLVQQDSHQYVSFFDEVVGEIMRPRTRSANSASTVRRRRPAHEIVHDLGRTIETMQGEDAAREIYRLYCELDLDNTIDVAFRNHFLQANQQNQAGPSSS